MMRKILKGLAIFLVVIILLSAAAIGYLWQHQELITDEVKTWYNNRYAGELEIGELRLNSWREWPNVRLEIDSISLRDTAWRGDDSTTLEIARLTAELSFKRILQREFFLKKITVHDGHLRMLSALDGTQNTGVFRELQPDFDANAEEKAGLLRLEQRPLQLEVNNFDLVLDNHRPDKHKRMAGHVRRLTTEVVISDTLVTAQVDSDLCLEGLGFNLDKGYYLSDQPVGMAFELSYDRRNLALEVPQFPFHVGDQTFLTEICLERSEGGEFHISLVNAETDFSAAAALLPEKTRAMLARYRVEQPLRTDIMIRGEFARGNNPWVQVDFVAPHNQVWVDGQVFSHFRGTGTFANRIQTDPAVALYEPRKNLQLTLDEAHCGYKGATLHFPEAAYRSTPEIPHLVDFVLNANGRLDDLNIILQNENFFFQDGTFHAHLDIVSTEQTLDQMLKTADGRLHLQNTRVEYRPAGIRMPLTELEVLLSPEAARVPHIRIPLSDAQEIHISGIVHNFGSLIFTDQDERVKSDLQLYSADLDFDNFVELVTGLQTTAVVADTRQTRLGETLKGIYHTFLPSLSVRLDRFAYQGIKAHDLSAKVAFLDAATLQLDSSYVHTGDSEIMLRGNFRVPDKQKEMQVGMDMEIKARGNTRDFNDAFANDTFLFEDGDYQFAGYLRGDVTDFRGLLHAARGRLAVQNTSVYFAPEQLRFPVRVIDLEVARQDIVLEEMTLGFPSGGQLHLAGRVDNFMDILSGVKNPLIRSVLGVQATYLDYADFSSLFSSIQANEQTVAESEFTQAITLANPVSAGSLPPAEVNLNDGQSSANLLKRSLRKIHQKFYPELTVRIDSFRHEQTLVTDIATDMSFQGSEYVQFTDMGFTYRNSPVRMSAALGLSADDFTPMELKFTTSRFDLGALVETYDYFGLPALQSADRIAGKVSLKADLRGRLVDSVGLDPKSLMGAVQFTLHEAELVNFEPIQKIADRFFRKERFESIRFAPITDTLFITQEVVHIPRMEIQSTAFNLFVEGHLNYDNNTNIWVSVPLRNFNAWEEGIVPLRSGYYSSGAKIFVEARGNEEGGMDYKFRLRKKKWYIHQGILPLFQEDRKYERRKRRQFRRERRAAKRLLRKNA